MNRRDFIKLLGLATAAVAMPAIIAQAIATPQDYEIKIDEWMRIFREELLPLELRKIEAVERDQDFGKMIRGLVTDGRKHRYFAFTIDTVDSRQQWSAEDFIREIARDLKQNMMIGLRK